MSELRNWVDELAVRIAQVAQARPFAIILISLLASLVIASGAQNLTFASNYRVFFSDANPELQAFESFQATYTKNDNFLVVIEPPDGEVFTTRTLSVVEKLTQDAWSIPYAIRVDSITNFQHTYAIDDELIVEDLVQNAEAMSQSEIDARREIALSEPLIRNQLLTADSSATAVNVVLQYPEESFTEVPEAANYVRGLVAEIETANPDLKLAISGVSMLNNAFSESGIMDMGTLIPIMYAVLLLVMVVAVRSVGATVATLMVILLSTLTAMGVAGFFGVALTPISAAAPTVILTLAIADSVHILVAMRAVMREGRSKREAITEAIRTNFLAVTITSLTTIVGFLALNFSDSPPYHHLGNITAVGIGFAWLFSITLLPAAVSLLPVRAPKIGGSAGAGKWLDGLANIVIANSKKVLFGSLAMTMTFVVLMPTLSFEDQWVEYFDQRLEIRRDNDFALQHFGLYPIEYSIPAIGPGGVSEPEYLATLGAFTEWLRSQPAVTHVYSLSDIMKRLNKNLNGDDPDFYRLPQERDLSAQYLLLYELSLPYGLDLNDRINIDKSASRLTATLTNLTTQETKAFLAEADAWLQDNAPNYMRTGATGAQVMFTYIAERNVESMMNGTIIAIVAIALIMILTLGSVGLGILSIIPNTLPILATYGAWALLVGTVGFSVASVAAVSLGIVVDDSVHFLTKYLRGQRERSLSREDSIRYAFRTVGLAIILNTIILAAGFMVLASSTFKLNGDMGLMTALAIGFALILDFFLLPTLLLNLPLVSQRSIQPQKGVSNDTVYTPTH